MIGFCRGRHLGFRLALLLLAGVLCLGQIPPAQAGAVRHALLIGVASYTGLPALATPVNDARSVAAALQAVQFQTVTVENPNLDRIDMSLSQFVQSVRPGEIALVYYSGYAVQDSGENYLVPVNYDPAREVDIDYAAYSVSRILSDVSARKPAATFLLLDASRESPALRQRFPQPGLALIEARNPEMLIVYSATAGKYSREVSGRPLSVYTQALVDSLAKPGLPIRQLLDEVRRSVSEATKGEQVPTEISTLVQPFVVNPRSPEAEAWERVRDTTDVAALEDFRVKFPNGANSADASRRIEQLEWERAQRTKDIKAFRDFLAKHPNGPFSNLARTEVASFEKAEQIAVNRRLVEEALTHYREAFESRNMEALKTVWPGLDRAQLNSIQGFFRLARTIKLELQPVSDAEITGDKATVRRRRVMTAADERGPMPAQDQLVEIGLSKFSGAMVIESIRVIGR